MKSSGMRIAILIGAMWVATLPVPGARMALAPGDEAPDLRGYTADGGRIVADFKANKVTLVNFWATWCEPCRVEMPALDKLYREHGDAGFQLIGVLKENITDEEVIEFLDSMGIAYPVIRPDSRVRGAWGGVGTLPTSFLIDRSGKVMRRYVGATPEQTEGLIFDVTEAINDRPLGPFILPETPNAVTDADRPKKPRP